MRLLEPDGRTARPPGHPSSSQSLQAPKASCRGLQSPGHLAQLSLSLGSLRRQPRPSEHAAVLRQQELCVARPQQDPDASCPPGAPAPRRPRPPHWPSPRRAHAPNPSACSLPPSRCSGVCFQCERRARALAPALLASGSSRRAHSVSALASRDGAMLPAGSAATGSSCNTIGLCGRMLLLTGNTGHCCVPSRVSPFSLFAKWRHCGCSLQHTRVPTVTLSPSTRIFRVQETARQYRGSGSDLHSPMTSGVQHLFVCLPASSCLFSGGAAPQILCPAFKADSFLTVLL